MNPAPLIDFYVSAKIEGEESQIAIIKLRPSEVLRAESGSMMYLTDGIEMTTSLGSGGMSSAMSRMLTGQNIFLTDFTYNGTDKGTVALGTDFPSKILRLSLDDLPEQTLVCQKGAYLASNTTVNIDMEFTRSLTAGFFGGEGFILQKLTGKGDVLVKGGGTIKEMTLRPGENLRVTSGSLVAFERSVNYDVQMVKGISNAMFGGEGLFMTTLTGPGRIWIQGMPPDRMIAAISQRVPSGGGIGLGVPIVMPGGGGEAAAGAGETAAGAGEAGTAGAAMVGNEAASMPEQGATPEASSLAFGDAAPESTASTSSSAHTLGNEDSSFGDNDTNAFSTEANEPTLEDGNQFGSDGEMFGDGTSSGDFGDTGGDAAGGVLGSIWDLVTGNNN